MLSSCWQGSWEAVASSQLHCFLQEGVLPNSLDQPCRSQNIQVVWYGLSLCDICYPAGSGLNRHGGSQIVSRGGSSVIDHSRRMTEGAAGAAAADRGGRTSSRVTRDNSSNTTINSALSSGMSSSSSIDSSSRSRIESSSNNNTIKIGPLAGSKLVHQSDILHVSMRPTAGPRHISLGVFNTYYMYTAGMSV